MPELEAAPAIVAEQQHTTEPANHDAAVGAHETGLEGRGGTRFDASPASASIHGSEQVTAQAEDQNRILDCHDPEERACVGGWQLLPALAPVARAQDRA